MAVLEKHRGCVAASVYKSGSERRHRKSVAQALRSEASAEISEAEQLTRAAAAGRQAAHESNS